MKKEKIHSDHAPAAIGAYVQAVRVGNLVYTSGQAGLDPATGKLVEGGVEAQAKRTMGNLAAVLEAAGSSLKNVIKTTIFLRYIKDFKIVNQVYASFFEDQYPARSTVAVSSLPMAALVEIEMVALVNEKDPNELTISPVTEDVEETEEKKKTNKEATPVNKKGKRKKKRAKSKKKKGKK